MDYKTMRNQIEDMANDNHKDFVKAIISVEKGINDESALDKLYDAYMDNDSLNLLHEEFDYMIEDLREQGQIKDLPYVQEEKDNLINIVGNIVGKVDVAERENKNGEAFKVANFSVVSKDDEGNKVYHNCSAYGEKSDIPKDFKQGDFVKLFGQIRTSIDDNGKEHSNVRILSSKLLKAKEQMKGQEEKKESVLGAIKKYQSEDKEKPKEKRDASKELRDKYMVGVVLGLHRLFFVYLNVVCLCKRKFVVKKVNKYDIMIKTKSYAWEDNRVENKL